jgi:hypothetical protein
MECSRCGGSMMLETVIKLRRRFIGFRETRSLGAYWAICKIGVPIEGADRTSATGPRLHCPADRGCERRGGPEPHARDRTPEISPRPTRHRVAARAWVISPSIRQVHASLVRKAA